MRLSFALGAAQRGKSMHSDAMTAKHSMADALKELGMDRDITRRDFLGGTALTLGAAMAPVGLSSRALAGVDGLDPYPPARTGMRGAHPGSFEAAHAIVEGAQWNAQAVDEDYDLIIVGAGISGLAAAYFYRRDVGPNARILILDNHDDFGGHAKRNEFTHEGKTYIGFGGTMLVEDPAHYPAPAKQLLKELGVPWQRVDSYYQGGFFAKHGLGRASFFSKERFGADHLALGTLFDPAILKAAPLSAQAKAQLDRLFRDAEDPLAGQSQADKRAIYEELSWQTYLQRYWGLEAEALSYVQKRAHGVWAIGADALPTMVAYDTGYPGFGRRQKAAGRDQSSGAGYFFFPDGNASLARLLVHKLVPAAARGEIMEDVVNARFDYGALDTPGNDVRIRLSSMVVSLKHRGGDLNAPVSATYVTGGAARTVTAKKALWAGYHAMLPYICPDVPPPQRAALATSVRAPLTYTTVLIRNWHSFQKLGFHDAYCPGSFFQVVRMTFPINMGGYQFAQSPDEPMVLHLEHIPLEEGLPPADQFRAGRQRLLQTPFETFERHIREQLKAMLGPGGFDPAQDILGITVNRWPHGYAYTADPQTGDVAFLPSTWGTSNRPWQTARARIGNIAVAGTDAASNAMSEAAIEEAGRAVSDLSATPL